MTFADEHAVANRGALVAMLESILTRGDLFEPAPTASLNSGAHRTRRLAGRPSHYIRNNHGIMMDRALLQLAMEFEGVNAHKAEHWSELAQRRLAEMFARTPSIRMAAVPKTAPNTIC